MRRIIQLILMSCVCLTMVAQKNAPKWMNKARKAVLTITTYGKDGNTLSTGTGFFVSENGDALSSYTLFKGAERATVTDADGVSYEVKTVNGADDLYDVIRFQVNVQKKVACLSLASEPQPEGGAVYLLPYSQGKNGTFASGKIMEVTNLKDTYKYYKLSMPLEEQNLNAPILTADGLVLALAQADASGNKECCYGLSAGYARSLSIGSADYLSSIYRNIGIAKGWPEQVDQAVVALYLITGTQQGFDRLATINDFIAHFSTASDGYQSRAEHYAYNRAQLASSAEEQQTYLKKALEDIQTAARYSGGQGDAFFNEAKLIYGVAIADTTLNDPDWTVDAALATLDKALAADNQPGYHQLKAEILFNRQHWQEAYDEYMVVCNSEAGSATSYYMAAKAKEQIPGFNIGDVIDLLTQAIEKGRETMPIEVSAYVLERIDWRLRLSQYQEAIEDYNLYITLREGRVTPDFFYMREQAKFKVGDFEGALADIQVALRVATQVPDYYAEEASIYMRMQKYEEAMQSLERALRLAPDFAACHRIKGVCYVRMGKKTEAIQCFEKAKEFGDPLAEKLIKEYSK